MTESHAAPGALRADLALIASLIVPGSRVLDIGCGDGALLEALAKAKNVDGRGIELSQAGVNACVARGLSVIQGDADTDLEGYPPGAFDMVVLAQTIQATRKPRDVLAQMLRIGRRAAVSFPNFGHWRVRAALGLTGRMPHTKSLPFRWYDTPNIHLCTVADFADLCGEMGLTIERAFALRGGAQAAAREIAATNPWANVFAQEAVFLLRAA